MLALDLPDPDPELKQHSAALAARIASEIRAQGPIPFQRYMELALYAPGLGYYAAGLRKFGRHGDFITAPELGEVYAECLAEAIAPLLRTLDDPVVMELGAGTGALAADLWLALEQRRATPARYLILERSADLRERQIAHLKLRVPHAMPRIAWLDQPPEARFDGVLFGNEVLDALPCARFEATGEGLREVYIDHGAQGFAEQLLAPRPEVQAALAHLQAELGTPWPSAYRSELVPELAAWMETVTRPLRSGLALFVDYGYPRREYYSAERHMGTLICHYRHRAHGDPYWYPGLNDLSAFVDFTAVAEAGRDAGLSLCAFDSQAGFLESAGIGRVYQDLSHRSERERMRLVQQIKRLMLPGEMGERFKLIGLQRGLEPEQLPQAFQLPGQRHRL